MTSKDDKALLRAIAGLLADLQLHEDDLIAAVTAFLVYAQDHEVWKLEVSADGKTFRNWKEYVADRLAQFSLSRKITRTRIDDMIQLLLSFGLPHLAVVAATRTSKGLVNEVSTGRRAARSDAGIGQKKASAETATEAVASAIRALERVRDKVASVSDPDMAKLKTALGETRTAMERRPAP
jgi:hypothetical protein